jgi:hypothetical protein
MHVGECEAWWPWSQVRGLVYLLVKANWTLVTRIAKTFPMSYTLDVQYAGLFHNYCLQTLNRQASKPRSINLTFCIER